MIQILLEGLLFVASIATIAALVFYLTRSSTSLGLRAQQNRNREAIERELDLVCSIHGKHTEEQLVRLDSGERICPECFREAMKGIVD
jgi:tRNA 2-selenouridine synthase SelU